MISRNVWAEGWGLLVERFCRGRQAEPSPGLVAVYLEQLDRELDDARFIAAVKLCIRDLEWFPSVAQLLERGGESLTEDGLELEAGKAFHYVMGRRAWSVVRGYVLRAEDVRELRPAAEAGVDPHAAWEAAVAAGVGRLERSTHAEEPFIRRDFVAAYKGARVGQERRQAAAQLGAGQAPAALPGAAAAPRQLQSGVGIDNPYGPATRHRDRP